MVSVSLVLLCSRVSSSGGLVRCSCCVLYLCAFGETDWSSLVTQFRLCSSETFFFLFLALCFVRLVCFFLLIFFYLPLFWGVLSSRIKVCVKWVVLSGCWGAFLSRGNLVYAKLGICLSIDGHRH